MHDNAYDHLIIGSTPVAALVAGLLRREHGRRACLVAEPYSAFGLERRFDLSIDLVTRPETLLLLRRVGAESLRLINGIGRNLVQPVDPLFIAESRASMAALGHFGHLLEALDYPHERVSDRNLAAGGMLRVRGQHLIAHHRFAPALEAWLQQSEVRRLDPVDTAIALRRDGSARITVGAAEVEAAHVVLADDAAILEHLPPDAWDRALARSGATALLLQPTRPAAHPLSLWLDRGLAVRQEPKGPLAAIVAGARETAESRLASGVAKALPLRRVGEAPLDRLVTSDGAPLLATARGLKLTHLAGFGLSAAFYAPAIARLLAGAATADEAAWFAARGATRGNQRLAAAEYA